MSGQVSNKHSLDGQLRPVENDDVCIIDDLDDVGIIQDQNVVYVVRDQNAMYYAAKNGRERFTRTLLGEDIHPDSNTDKGLRTALAVAVRFSRGFGGGGDDHPRTQEDRHRSIVRMLLAHGADPLKKFAFDGSCALHEAASGTNGPEMIGILIDHVILNQIPLAFEATDSSGQTLLHWACMSNPFSNAAVASILLDHVDDGVDPSAPDDDGNTPLHISSIPPHVLNVLVQGGANVNRRNDAGETPLFRIARSHDGYQEEKVEKVRSLLIAGADPSITNRWGWTPEYASRYINKDVSEVLRQARITREAEAALELSRQRSVAFCMGQHPRLGIHANYCSFDPNLLHFIIDYI